MFQNPDGFIKLRKYWEQNIISRCQKFTYKARARIINRVNIMRAKREKSGVNG